MKQYIRKADIILLIALVIIGLAASALLAMHGNAFGETNSGAVAVIKSGGSVIGRYPLSEDAELEIPAPAGTEYSSPKGRSLSEDDDCTHYVYYNIVRIGNGSISVTGASCKNQVCVKHSSISRPGETIVCLPNRLIISIEGSDDKGGGYDSITS